MVLNLHRNYMGISFVFNVFFVDYFCGMFFDILRQTVYGGKPVRSLSINGRLFFK
jgi:hypothetical protein